jgi:RNA polymerase sigma-70 factor (ECF subfamily)
VNYIGSELRRSHFIKERIDGVSHFLENFSPANVILSKSRDHRAMPKDTFKPLKPDDLCRWIDTHGPALLLYAKQWNTNDADDIVQEAILRMVRRAHWEGTPDNPAAYLFTAVRNEAIDRQRKAKRRKMHENQAAIERPIWLETPPDSSLRASELLETLDKLPMEQREIVVARIWGGLTFDEIAAMMGDSRTTVHRRYSEALEVLREMLG